MMKITIEYISPNSAGTYLEKNRTNRTISSSHVAKLAKTMLAGEYHCTHQGIAFDEDGYLVDGQHRLSAVIVSATTQRMTVARNVPHVARSVIDNQMRPRSVADVLAIEGHPLGNKRAIAAARLWLMLLGNNRSATHEIRDFLNSHSRAIAFGCDVAGGDPILQHSSVLTMIALAWEAGHGDDIRGWAEVVKSGVACLDWHTSATRFREWWLTNDHGGGGHSRCEYCHRVFSSMSAWIERRPLSKIYAKQAISWIGSSGS